MAQKNRAYIAGGFVERLAYFNNELNQVTLYPISLQNYLYTGDIDLFFHDEQSFKACAKDIENVYGEFTMSSNSALTKKIRVSSFEEIKIQLIKYQFAPPSEALKRFDIYNVACYVDFTSNRIFVDKHTHLCINNYQIDFLNFEILFDSFSSCHRLLAWVSHHPGYQSLSTQANLLLSDKLQKELKLMPIAAVHQLSKFLTQKIFRLSPDTILLLASILPPGGYPNSNPTPLDVLKRCRYIY